jgi:hypothetical protein
VSVGLGAERQRAFDFLDELATRIEGWAEPVSYVQAQRPDMGPDEYPTLSFLGRPGIEESSLSVGVNAAEITVEFGPYHTHFDYETGGRYGRENAFLFIQGLQSEHLAVGARYENRRPLFAWVCNPATGDCIYDYPLLGSFDPRRLRLTLPWRRHYVHILSWRGAYNTYYTLSKARDKVEIPQYSGTPGLSR